MKKIVFSAALTAVVGWVAFTLVGNQPETSGTDHLANSIEAAQSIIPGPVVEPGQAAAPTEWKTMVAGGEDSRLAKRELAPVKDPIGAFKRWADEFMAGTGDELEGLRLAKARRDEMARLIRENPAKAIANRVNPDTREVLPESIRGELEQPLHGRGRFDALSISRLAKSSHVSDVAAQYHGLDPRLAKRSDEKRLVQSTVQELTHNGRAYTAHTYGALRGLTSREDLLFNGIALDGHVALDESPVRLMGKTSKANALATGEVEDEGQDPITGETVNLAKGGYLAEAGGSYYVLSRKEHASKLGVRLMGAEAGVSPKPGLSNHISAWEKQVSQGSKDVLIIRVNFADDQAEPPSIPELERAMKEVNDFFVESSYGTLSFTTTLTPTQTLPKSKLWYDQAGQTLIKDSAIELAGVNGFDVANYDVIMIAIDDLPGPSYEGWVVTSFGEGLFIKGGFVEAIARNMAAILIGETKSADYWDTVAPVKIEADPMSEDPPTPHSLADLMGRDSIYGPGSLVYEMDMWSLMGGGNRQFNTPTKHKLGWLPASAVADVTESTTVRLYAYDVARLTDGGVHAMRIVKDEKLAYWLQYRVSNQRSRWSPGEETFIDTFGEEKQISPLQDQWSKNGLQLLMEDAGSLSKLLDASPGSAGLDVDSPLMIGRTFVEQSIGLHVTPVAQSEPEEEVPWIDVVVNVGSFLDNRSPKMELTASETSVNEEDEVTFTASALDPDGDALGIYWDFGDGNYAYSESEVTHTFELDGEYLVRCEITDMKGGHTSRYVVVTVGDPRTIRISGKVISDIGIPVENMQVAAQEAVAGDPEAELVGPMLRSFTDEEGNFVIVGVERDKSYALNANFYGYRTSPVGFSIPLEINDMDAADLLFLASEIPKINILATTPSTAEGQGLPTFLTVTRTGNLMEALEVDFGAFWEHVGCHLASIWEPKSTQNRPKMRLQTLSCSKT